MAANNDGRMSSFNSTFLFHIAPTRYLLLVARFSLPINVGTKHSPFAPNSSWRDEQASVPTSFSLRPLRIVVVIGAAVLLNGCGSINSWLASAMADHIPEWAGGLPAGVPPRPGTAEYDTVKKSEAASIQPAPQAAKLPYPTDMSLKGVY
jgi:hypothetical protein